MSENMQDLMDFGNLESLVRLYKDQPRMYRLPADWGAGYPNVW